ncbi:MAG: hypothetical protein HC842_08690 [Cytophagales bacterium]|nr:hypothetical protein [Cytophagales bacterium]
MSGIGASAALALLSSLNSGQVKSVIAKEEVATLKTIKGLGPKRPNGWCWS